MTLQKRYNGILEEEDKSDKTPHLVIVLEEINLIMRKHIIKNLLTRLQPLLNSKEYTKTFHWWFDLFLDPQYVTNINYVK